jgi:hypothetical protein
VVRAGDCVKDPGQFAFGLEEQPCGGPGQLKVLARVDAAVACPVGTKTRENIIGDNVPRPKLCLGDPSAGAQPS